LAALAAGGGRSPVARLAQPSGRAARWPARLCCVRSRWLPLSPH
jgi:hypothetical protein